MDYWKMEKPRSKNPSFSSSLLDAIYRSIDEKEKHEEEGEEEVIVYSSKKSSNMKGGEKKSVKQEEESFRRVEKWMEKKVSEKVVYRRQSLPDFDRKTLSRSSQVFHSASSSSDSSCGGVFSSSEAESWNNGGSRTRSSSLASQRPKPVRIERSEVKKLNVYEYEHSEKHKPEGGFNKTKSRAMKMYKDLKRAKQPISPGGKLATFLNSIFTSANVKKGKVSNEDRKPKSAQVSTCSSASSFSRSCLSKTPSTRGKPVDAGALKRSVRFYPVSVIVDEDSRPCGHKCLPEENPKVTKLNEELKFHLMEKNRRIEAAARDLLKNYREKCDVEMRDQDNDDDSDDDVGSDCSSDLFELDNLGVVGIQRYREELPVYETTHLKTNRAIANGLIV